MDACAICLEPMDNLSARGCMKLMCDHVFHENCLKRHMKSGGGTCPLCRANLPERAVVVNYALHRCTPIGGLYEWVAITFRQTVPHNATARVGFLETTRTDVLKGEFSRRDESFFRDTNPFPEPTAKLGAILYTATRVLFSLRLFKDKPPLVLSSRTLLSLEIGVFVATLLMDPHCITPAFLTDKDANLHGKHPFYCLRD